MPKFQDANSQWQGILMLVMVTVLWGSTFVVVKDAIDKIPANLINLGRFGLASIFFIPFIRLKKDLFKAGFELGFWLFVGYATQTIGLQYTTVNRSAFITTLYVIFLPLLLGCLGRPIKRASAIAAILAFIGVGLLSYEGSPPNLGDIWTVATALSWVMYIWRLEVYANRFSSRALTGVQILGTAGFCFLWVLISKPLWLSFTVLNENLPWLSILYLGIVTTAMTIWLQTWGQARISATSAAVIYSLEPVWASLFAYWLLNEKLGVQGIVGMGLIIGAILVSQLPIKSP